MKDFIIKNNQLKIKKLSKKYRQNRRGYKDTIKEIDDEIKEMKYLYNF